MGQAGVPEACFSCDSWFLFEMRVHFIVIDSLNLLPVRVWTLNGSSLNERVAGVNTAPARCNATKSCSSDVSDLARESTPPQLPRWDYGLVNAVGQIAPRAAQQPCACLLLLSSGPDVQVGLTPVSCRINTSNALWLTCK